MHHLRCLFLMGVHFEFILKAAHIPGKLNVAADAIFRKDLPLFHSQVLEPNPLPSGTVYMELLVSQIFGRLL